MDARVAGRTEAGYTSAKARDVGLLERLALRRNHRERLSVAFEQLAGHIGTQKFLGPRLVAGRGHRVVREIRIRGHGDDRRAEGLTDSTALPSQMQEE